MFKYDADMIVIPVNCVGVLGCGVARQFKKLYADKIDASNGSPITYYEFLCGKNIDHDVFNENPYDYPINDMAWISAYDCKMYLGCPKYFNCKVSKQVICYFPTKYHWKNSAELATITTGLLQFVKELPFFSKVKTVNIPALGCGAGGLNWEDVKPLMKRYLSQIPNVKITIFIPQSKISKWPTQ